MTNRCPCCQRPLEKMLDYPLVLVRNIDILPIPEVMDYWSEDAAKAASARDQLPDDMHPGDLMRLRGINRTPEVASAYHSAVIQDYFRELQNHQGVEVPPNRLLPQLAPDTYFKYAYPLPGTQLYVGLPEGEPEAGDRFCRIVFYGKGPNLGSAGGPTLQELGAAATIKYVGRLLL